MDTREDPVRNILNDLYDIYVNVMKIIRVREAE